LTSMDTEELRHSELNEKKWDRRARDFDDKRFNYFRFMQKRLISLLDLKENQRLLDIGCGTGWAVRYAASLVKEHGEFCGIDISSKMIEKAIANSSDYKNVHFYRTGAEKLPFKNNYFDFIICSNSFHHYFSPEKVLSEVYRVLKPAGKIYILDITSDGFITRMVDRWIKKREPEHVKFYSTEEYRRLFFNARLHYLKSRLLPGRLTGFPMKVHIGEKNKRTPD
jgi:ubiquinone/menaquinone biosynthesis C-methylase UbiE